MIAQTGSITVEHSATTMFPAARDCPERTQTNSRRSAYRRVCFAVACAIVVLGPPAVTCFAQSSAESGSQSRVWSWVIDWCQEGGKLTPMPH